MSERDCTSCKYGHLSIFELPCIICVDDSKEWKDQNSNEKIKTKLINTTDPQFLPSRKYAKDAGADLRARVDHNILFNSGGMVKIPTGIGLEIPEGHVGIVTARSGATTEGKVTMLGVIDSDYRGEIGLNVVNMGAGWAEIVPGERLAQIIILPCYVADFEQVDALSETDRGSKGFGSTGKL